MMVVVESVFIYRSTQLGEDAVYRITVQVYMVWNKRDGEVRRKSSRK